MKEKTNNRGKINKNGEKEGKQREKEKRRMGIWGQSALQNSMHCSFLSYSDTAMRVY